MTLGGKNRHNRSAHDATEHLRVPCKQGPGCSDFYHGHAVKTYDSLNVNTLPTCAQAATARSIPCALLTSRCNQMSHNSQPTYGYLLPPKLIESIVMATLHNFRATRIRYCHCSVHCVTSTTYSLTYFWFWKFLSHGFAVAVVARVIMNSVTLVGNAGLAQTIRRRMTVISTRWTGNDSEGRMMFYPRIWRKRLQ